MNPLKPKWPKLDTHSPNVKFSCLWHCNSQFSGRIARATRFLGQIPPATPQNLLSVVEARKTRKSRPKLDTKASKPNFLNFSHTGMIFLMKLVSRTKLEIPLAGLALQIIRENYLARPNFQKKRPSFLAALREFSQILYGQSGHLYC